MIFTLIALVSGFYCRSQPMSRLFDLHSLAAGRTGLRYSWIRGQNAEEITRPGGNGSRDDIQRYKLNPRMPSGRRPYPESKVQ
jgi:hypothetical protein